MRYPYSLVRLLVFDTQGTCEAAAMLVVIQARFSPSEFGIMSGIVLVPLPMVLEVVFDTQGTCEVHAMLVAIHAVASPNALGITSGIVRVSSDGSFAGGTHIRWSCNLN
jgi:hypothetical protein